MEAVLVSCRVLTWAPVVTRHIQHLWGGELRRLCADTHLRDVPCLSEGNDRARLPDTSSNNGASTSKPLTRDNPLIQHDPSGRRKNRTTRSFVSICGMPCHSLSESAESVSVPVKACFPQSASRFWGSDASPPKGNCSRPGSCRANEEKRLNRPGEQPRSVRPFHCVLYGNPWGCTNSLRGEGLCSRRVS